MARQKKPVHRVQMTEGKRNIIHQLLKSTISSLQKTFRMRFMDLLGGTIKEMMEGNG